MLFCLTGRSRLGLGWILPKSKKFEPGPVCNTTCLFVLLGHHVLLLSSLHAFMLSRAARIRLCFLQPHATHIYPRNIRFLKMSPQTPLDFQSGPMVWIDCEMSGLDPRRNKILEIAVSILRVVTLLCSNLFS